MEPITLISVITAGIPFVTALFKKVAGTDKIQNEDVRTGVHALIPVLLGVLAAGLSAHSRGMNWITSIAIGLGSGGAASSARDIDKNLIGIADVVVGLFQKKKT